ncbi:MAG: hypothetical protein HN736_18200 [Anaerolineae bacterium]|jgi:hypothetical protein|nr:hypothetical protein [Anaerolineae bacterium]MBT3714499.1 hypothetical protein [Anaerolineae bacterium]MBT4310291.1 hypothetical protein [Anaerolineae bacterium]MBT4459042.1 hypothetical protein [Anaerolineae bacterium]MBT6060128.1 hypothetical protein [Anaerolineae bacterium]
MDYGYALTRAWKITWKYKVLWIFGILAGCGSNGNNGGSSNANTSQDMDGMPPELIEFSDKALTFLAQPAVIIGLIVFILLLIILTAFLSTIGRVGLISGIYRAEVGAESLSFGELFKDGTSRFWRFFGMNFLVSLPFIIVIVGLVGAGIFVAISADNANIAEEFLVGFIPAICVIFCCLFLFALIFGMIVQQAQNAMIIEDRGISESLMRGWEVFKSNLGHLILIAIILFIISAVVGVIIALPILIVVVPGMIAFVLDGAQSMQPLIFMGLCIVAYLPISLVANGILTTYVQAVWTLFYLQITEQTPEIPKEDTIIEYA